MAMFPEFESYVPVSYQHVLMTDDNRMNCFKQAISTMVPDGGVVLDGSFGTGVFSSFAARKARKVYAVESDRNLFRLGLKLIAENGLEGKIELYHGSLSDFVPPEHVDIVMLDVLHAGLFYTPQVKLLGELRRNLADNGPYTVLPYLSLNCIQPVHVDFNYCGYNAPFARYQHAYWVDERVKALSDPQVYWVADFQDFVSTSVQASVEIKIKESAQANAVRFITKNVLSNQATDGRLIEWFSHYLIVPLQDEISVSARDRLKIDLSYEAGHGIGGLVMSVQCADQMTGTRIPDML